MTAILGRLRPSTTRFSMKRERLSPRFTTSWSELLRVRC
ncbi:DUF4113 domain-containing protein [Pseudomonas aeruginosa]